MPAKMLRGSSIDWKPCIKRQDVVIFPKDGEQRVEPRCAHVSCESFGKGVSQDGCEACPVRVPSRPRHPGYSERLLIARDFGQPSVLPGGVLVYKQTGWEPPPPHHGYRRKSDDIKSPDAWTFIPLWPPCRYREMHNAVRPCGCLQINASCICPHAEHNGQPVTISLCQACPLAQPPEE
jgi:hypothetical protein